MNVLELTEPYRIVGHLTGEMLLRITQNIKAGQVSRGLKPGMHIRHNEVCVNRRDIEVVADALKSYVFFIPTNSYNEAFELAQKEGVANGL